MDIVVDFDGTVVAFDYPLVGKDIGSVPVLKKLVQQGHRLILFTMRCDSREGLELTDAVNWFKENDIPLFGIQTNPRQKSWTTSPKAHAHLYIDDRGLGIPLKIDTSISQVEFVDWIKVEEMLIERGILKK